MSSSRADGAVGREGPSLSKRIERGRRFATALLGLMGMGLGAVCVSWFLAGAPSAILFAGGVLSLSACFAALLVAHRRLSRALDPERVDEMQRLTARSLRTVPGLWDGLAPVLELIGRILEGAEALSRTVPWLASKLHGLGAAEAKVVVDGVLASGPEARDAVAELAAGVEAGDLARLRSGLERLGPALEGVGAAVERFANRGRTQ